MSSKNMHVYKPKEFFKLLNSLGFYYHHENSSHKIYANIEGYYVTIPVGHSKKELQPAMTKLALQRIDRGLCDKLDINTINKYKEEFFLESGSYIQV